MFERGFSIGDRQGRLFRLHAHHVSPRQADQTPPPHCKWGYGKKPLIVTSFHHQDSSRTLQLLAPLTVPSSQTITSIEPLTSSRHDQQAIVGERVTYRRMNSRDHQHHHTTSLPLASDSSSELKVLGLDGHSLCVDGAEVGVHELRHEQDSMARRTTHQVHQIVFDRLEETHQGPFGPPIWSVVVDLGLDFYTNLPDKSLEGKLLETKFGTIV